MNIAFGDLWDWKADYIVITTNGILKQNGAAVMGAGIARQARDRYTGIDFELGKLIKDGGNHVYKLSHKLITFPTKHDWRNPADMRLIMNSAMEIVELLADEPDVTVIMPPPGCENGDLEWSIVCALLYSMLDNRFTVLLNKSK